MFSLVCFTFRCELISNVQNTPHTTRGSNRGKNIVSDCCIKIATTPSRPKMIPNPLRAIDAWSSIFCFSIINIGITTVYESMFLQLQKYDEKICSTCPCFHCKGVRNSRYFLCNCIPQNQLHTESFSHHSVIVARQNRINQTL